MRPRAPAGHHLQQRGLRAGAGAHTGAVQSGGNVRLAAVCVQYGCVWMRVPSQPDSRTAAKPYVARLYACNWLLFGCLYA
jgi:hypothetical protein